MAKKQAKEDTGKKDGQNSQDSQDSKIGRMTADLEASRAKKDEFVTQLHNRIAWLTNEWEMAQRQNEKTKIALKIKSEKVEQLEAELKDLQDKYSQVRKDKGAKGKLPDWLFTWQKVMEADIPIANHKIMVSRLIGTLEFPTGYEHAGQIDPEQLDDDTLKLSDLKDFIKSEFGAGHYRLRSFNMESGFDRLAGITQFSIK